MVVDAAATKAKFWSALQKICEIVDRITPKVKLAVKDLGELLVETYWRKFASKSPIVFPLDPAQRLYEIKVVLRLRLVGLGRRTKLESGTDESKLVDAVGQIVRRPGDTRLTRCDGRNVNIAVVDSYIAEAEVTDPRRREDVSLGVGEE